MCSYDYTPSIAIGLPLAAQINKTREEHESREAECNQAAEADQPIRLVSHEVKPTAHALQTFISTP